MTLNYDLGKNKDNFGKYSNVNSKLILDFSIKGFEPTVSILIPTYKRPDLLQEALESVIKQVAEIDFEIIVVDNDASLEFSDEIVNFIMTLDDHSIKYYVNECNIGMFGNWNRCIELAIGEWYTILNDDDILHPLFLDSMYDFLRNNSSASLVSTNAVFFSDENDLEKKSIINKNAVPEKINYKSMLWGHFTNGSLGTLYKTQLSIKLGGYDESLYPNSDYFFATKYVFNYESYILANKTAYARWAVNESMKLDTIRNNIRNDYLMWSTLNEFYLNSGLVNIFEFRFYSVLFKVLCMLKVRSYSRTTNHKATEIARSIPFKVNIIFTCGNWFLSRVAYGFFKSFKSLFCKV